MGFLDRILDWFESNKDFIMTTGARALAVICLIVAIVYMVIFYKQLQVV